MENTINWAKQVSLKVKSNSFHKADQQLVSVRDNWEPLKRAEFQNYTKPQDTQRNRFKYSFIINTINYCIAPYLIEWRIFCLEAAFEDLVTCSRDSISLHTHNVYLEEVLRNRLSLCALVLHIYLSTYLCLLTYGAALIPTFRISQRKSRISKGNYKNMIVTLVRIEGTGT